MPTKLGELSAGKYKTQAEAQTQADIAMISSGSCSALSTLCCCSAFIKLKACVQGRYQGSRNRVRSLHQSMRLQRRFCDTHVLTAR